MPDENPSSGIAPFHPLLCCGERAQEETTDATTMFQMVS